MHALLVHVPGAAPVRRDLDGPLLAGGSHADGVHLPGCPAGALRLLPCAAGVVVEAVARGVRAAGHTVHPGGRRLLRPGERIELQGTAIEVASAAPPEGTRAAAAALLRDAIAGGTEPPGLHLVVLSGPAAGARHPLANARTIGRGRRASIVLPDETISRVHARVTALPDGGARVEDVGSKNGLRLNGVPVDRRSLRLRVGDELTVGETTLALADGAAASPDGSKAPRRRVAREIIAALLLAISAAALALAAG